MARSVPITKCDFNLFLLRYILLCSPLLSQFLPSLFSSSPLFLSGRKLVSTSGFYLIFLITGLLHCTFSDFVDFSALFSSLSEISASSSSKGFKGQGLNLSFLLVLLRLLSRQRSFLLLFSLSFLLSKFPFAFFHYVLLLCLHLVQHNQANCGGL